MGIFKAAWIRYRRARRFQRDLTKAFAERSVDFMSLPSQTHESIIEDAMAADVASTVAKWMPILQAFSDFRQKRELLGRHISNLGKPSSKRDAEQLTEAEMSGFAKLIASPLEVQLMMAGGRSIFSPSGIPNPRAVGYVYGWTDAFLRVGGWDMADIDIGVPVLFHALRHLWPGKQD